MGTSSNHPSPNIPIWRPLKAVLGATQWPVERQSLELWRAALSDRNGILQKELADPILARASVIAETGESPINAQQIFRENLNDSHAAGLTLDMGHRALVRAVATKSGAQGFAAELFAEAASYYVSRDLPSIFGQRGRVNTSTESIEFKDQIRRVAREAVKSAKTLRTDNEGWAEFVSEVLTVLHGGRGRK